MGGLIKVSLGMILAQFVAQNQLEWEQLNLVIKISELVSQKVQILGRVDILTAVIVVTQGG